MNDVDEQKRAAGYAAVDRHVRADTCIGLGTGSTAYWAIDRVGQLVAAGKRIVAVATSAQTESLCRERGIPLCELMECDLDVAIDGADEVAADGSLTKGGGGALFREKAVALAARRFVVIVSAEKLVRRLGAFPTPVEVVPFALRYVEREIGRMRPAPRVVRRLDATGAPFRTDNGNAILDCAFTTIDQPRALAKALQAIHGVVDHGLFVGVTDAVLVAQPGGVRELSFVRS